MKFGIALGGGGVRGAFQIGVWKALRKLDIEICAAVGTSIGAINGALIAQDEYETAVRLWQNIRAKDIIALPDNAADKTNILSAGNMAALAGEFYKNRSLDLAPLELLLKSVIDENKLRNSKTDFGAAVFSLTDKKGIYKYKDQIPAGGMIDFITASASIFSTKEVDGEIFSDGGIYDNMPVTMLTEKGIDNIITVDVRGIGRTRSVNRTGRNIICIRSKERQTGLMEFDRAGIVRYIDEGYIEAMRAFGQVMGEVYAFYAGDYTDARKKYSSEIISGLEKAAELFDINKFEIYTVEGLKSIVTDAYYKALQKGTLPKTLDAKENPRLYESADEGVSAILYFLG